METYPHFLAWQYESRPTRVHPKCPLEWPSMFLNPLVFYPHFLLIELFVNWWIYALSWRWSCGRKHADDWRFAIGGTHSILWICAQWNELGIRWCFLNAFCLNFHDNGSNTCLCWFFITTEWQWLMPTQDPWRRGSESLNFRISNRNHGFMQVRKETLRVAPLGVGLGDLPADRPKVRMMLDLYFNFPAKTTLEQFGFGLLLVLLRLR